MAQAVHTSDSGSSLLAPLLGSETEVVSGTLIRRSGSNTEESQAVDLTVAKSRPKLSIMIPGKDGGQSAAAPKRVKPNLSVIVPCPVDEEPEVESRARDRLAPLGTLDVRPVAVVTAPQVRQELRRLEDAVMPRYIARFDQNAPGRSILDVLRSKYPRARVELKNIAEGVTDTKLVMVNGVARHVLKRVSLPAKVLGEHWGDVKSRLIHSGAATLTEQVRSVFFDSPGQILSQNYPHFNNAQREKLAYVVGGASLGVPQTEVFKASEGTFSLHAFVPNAGSALKFDLAKKEHQAKINLQSLQNIGILDIILENQDRNPGNILVVPRDTTPWYACCFPCLRTEELDLVPIDHALSMQHENFQAAVAFAGIKAPCWTHWEKADEPLTAQTKTVIAHLNPRQILAEAQRQGIVVDAKIRRSIQDNIAFLQQEVRRRPEVTLNQLYQASTR